MFWFSVMNSRFLYKLCSFVRKVFDLVIKLADIDEVLSTFNETYKDYFLQREQLLAKNKS